MSLLDSLHSLARKRREIAELEDRFWLELANELSGARSNAQPAPDDDIPFGLASHEEIAPQCNCGLPAVKVSGTAKNGKGWAGWFCPKKKSDPRNCGFKQWID